MRQNLYELKGPKLYNSYWLVSAVFFLGIAAFLYNGQADDNRLEQATEKLTKHLATCDVNFDDFVAELALENYDFGQKIPSQSSHASYLLFNRNVLKSWSDHNAIITTKEGVAIQFEDRAIEDLRNGQYYTRVKLLSRLGEQWKLVGLFQLKQAYEVNNRHLKTQWFADLPDDLIIGEQLTSDGTKLELANKVYDVSFTNKPIMSFQWLAALLFAAGLLAVLVSLYRFCLVLGLRTNNLLAFILLTVLLSAGRYLMLKLNWPNVWQQSELFSPNHFGTSFWIPSLGDLIVNITLLLCGVFFFYNRVNSILKGVLLPGLGKQMFGVILIVLGFSSIGEIVNRLVVDSDISFSLSYILKINVYSLLGVLCICSLLVAVYLATLKLLSLTDFQIIPLASKLFVIIVACILTAFSMLFWKGGIQVVSIAFSALAILFIVLFKYQNIRIWSFPNVVFWLVSFAAISAYWIQSANTENELERKKVFAQQLTETRDPIAELLFNTSINSIVQDSILKVHSQTALHQNELNDLENRLLVFFPDHFKQYEINFYYFDVEGNSSNQVDDRHLNDWIKEIDFSKEDILSGQLYGYNCKNCLYGYFGFAEILVNERAAESLVGFIGVSLIPRRIDRSNIYPELMVEDKYRVLELKDHYDFLSFKDDRIIHQNGNFLRPSAYNLDTINGFVDFKNGKRHFVGYFGVQGYETWIASQLESPLQPFSLFSYIFFLYLLVILLVQLILFIIDLYRNKWRWNEVFQLTFRHKIQLVVTSIVLLSFFFIGTLTIINISNQYDDYHEQRLMRKVKQVNAGLTLSLLDENGSLERLLNYPPELIKQLNTLAGIHSMDINIYDENGFILATSQPAIFSKGLISNRIAPKAFRQLSIEGNVQVIQNEKIGSLEYLSAYVPLQNENGTLLGILNLPYFAKEKNLNKEISGFLTYFIDVYVLLLVFSGIIVLLVSNSMTRPLKIIGNKLKEVKVGQRNQPISYKNNDEIGQLVRKYNLMIAQLDESAEKLSQSERESAWREMAKQVAHEIKNPLTPMKLSIQHLQRAYSDDHEQLDDIMQRVSKTLIEQIDSLSSIATEFSSFAKMPKADRQRLNLCELLQSAATLFENEAEELTLRLPEEEVEVYADKTQLSRVLNNLIKNALQAIPPERLGRIEIQLTVDRDASTGLIMVKDNGTGISEDQQEKVFVPSFTTKNSGMGLGLAMCKKIVEGEQGRIWFETKLNVGTSFYVQLPILKRDIS